MSDKVHLILNDYKNVIEEILGAHLVRIVLYGSYARGDFNLEINPSVQSNTTYNQWKKVYPLFINIEKEGVAV